MATPRRLRTERSFPKRLLAHVETWRPYTTAYPGLLALAGAGVTGRHSTAAHLVLAWAGLTAVWLGAHYLGDYLDRHLDAAAKPHRPIPSGRLSPTSALVSATACFAALVIAGVLFNPRTVPVSLALMAGIGAYSGLLKARGLLGNVGRGALTALGICYGALAVQPWPTVALLPVALAFWCHDVSTNLVGTLRDVDGDRAGGYRTLPVRIGVVGTVRFTMVCYAAAIVLAVTTPWILGHVPLGFLVLFPTAVGTGALAFGQLARQGAALSAVAALRCHMVLSIERILLAGAFAAFVVPLDVIVPLVAVLLTLSTVAQLGMRARHEFGVRRGLEGSVG
jgi:geranylgeranylglycerol-phosphate geranylgeranyltransferase